MPLNINVYNNNNNNRAETDPADFRKIAQNSENCSQLTVLYGFSMSTDYNAARV